MPKVLSFIQIHRLTPVPSVIFMVSGAGAGLRRRTCCCYTIEPCNYKVLYRYRRDFQKFSRIIASICLSVSTVFCRDIHSIRAVELVLRQRNVHIHTVSLICRSIEEFSASKCTNKVNKIKHHKACLRSSSNADKTLLSKATRDNYWSISRFCRD